MTRYIDTPAGKIAVESTAGIGPDDDILVVDLEKVREILGSLDHMPGIYQQWLVHDEDELVERLKERFGEL